MISYADYDFYKNTYRGTMGEDDFDRNILLSSQYIRYLTAGKSDQYAGDELKYASCEVADLQYNFSHGSAGTFGRVKSENNDGYSVSYVSEGKDGETDESLFTRKAYSAVRKWLIPTGLMNRKVGCHCDNQCRYYPV